MNSKFSLSNLAPHLLKSLASRLTNRKQTPSQISTSLVLPEDVLLEIAKYLSHSDVFALSLSSRYLFLVFFPALYATVDLKSNLHCKKVLTLLEERPEVAQRIRELVIRPNYEATKLSNHLDESWVVSTIERIAEAGNLRNLHNFKWEGLKMPDDHLWATLRTSCHELRTIGTSFSGSIFDPESHLFDFTGLRGFSLNVKCHNHSAHSLELPPRLWAMLMENSPDLQELCITGVPQAWPLIKVGRVARGRWPQLRSLTLGNFSDRVTSLDTHPAPWNDFLQAHHALERFSVGGIKVLPKLQPLLPEALPHLKFFSGHAGHLWMLRDFSALTALQLTCEPVGSYTRHVSNLETLLENLPLLTYFGLWVETNLQVAYGLLLQSLMTACSNNLRELELVGPLDYCISVDVIEAAIGHFTRLETFSLLKLHHSPDGDVDHIASRIVRSHSSLRKLTLKSASHVEFNITHLKQISTYNISRNGDGNPASLRVHQWQNRRRWDRRYTYTLPKTESLVDVNKTNNT